VCGCAVAVVACGPLHSVTIGRSPDGPVYEEPGPGHGPPPHAPAHGYRYKQQHAYAHGGGDVELVFDSGLGVYVVVSLPGTYYWNDVYLRLQGERWYAAAHLDGPWKPSTQAPPPGLRAKHAKAKSKKKKGGPAKQRGW